MDNIVVDWNSLFSPWSQNTIKSRSGKGKRGLARFDNWEIKEKSNDFRSLDSHTIEFPITLKPDEEKIVTYKVHYTW
jgi:hypothetical protein